MAQLLEGGVFNPDVPVGEILNLPTKSYVDMNVGLLYNYTGERGSFFSSVGVYNVLQHKENLQPDVFRVPVRYSLMSGGQFEAGYSGKVHLSVYHLRQGGTYATTLGGAYGILIDENHTQELTLGLWHRLKDAVIPYVGYQLNGVQVGLSYDYTISGVKTAGQTRNAYELTFLYRAPDNSELKRLVPWY